MNDTLISCRNIEKIYMKGKQEIRPLQELSLDVKKGEFLALMGPSGSGKTTLLNLLAGIDSPNKGQLLFQGEDISRYSRKKLCRFRAKHVGYIFQLYHLVPVLTAYENVELPLLITPLSAKQRHERVSSALEMANIADRASHYPRQLSGGQEQRVAIARALVSDPPLIVADEPTGDLDAESATYILGFLQKLSREFNKTIVMVTHDPGAAKYASRTLHLDKGHLLEKGHVDS